MNIADKILGDYTSLNKDRIKDIVVKINELSSSMKALKNEDFMVKTNEFKERLKNGETKESIMIEAFALCREAVFRKLNMFPYDVQVEAAVAMQDGTVAEMKTGEGKTLVQILCAYLNALDSSSVHVVSANDYLAERDFEQNKVVFEFLGLSTGLVINKSTPEERKKAYSQDILYSTISNIGFDYLRDNTTIKKNNQVITRDFGYIIIDEVDSILIDEATTPLILSREDENALSENDKQLYALATLLVHRVNCQADSVIRTSRDKKKFFQENNNVDILFSKKDLSIELKPEFENAIYNFLENRLNLNSDELSMYYLNFLEIFNKCVIANYYYEKGKHYILGDKKEKNEKEILLIDGPTGRIAKGKKFTRGIHEAISAKEDYLAKLEKKDYTVKIEKGKINVGICTYPDLLSMYKSGKCGMTGTSSEQEFEEIYGMPTYRVDTRKENIRADYDKVYLTKAEKYDAIMNDIINFYQMGRPVLVGTESVKESLLLSNMLKEKFIIHNVLNAEKVALESSIIATAGQYGSVTIATNMAGRGTDIKLGDGVRELGGLKVIGTSRNIAKRIDSQLRGRASRQGDPGETIYYSSLEDELLVKDGSLRNIYETKMKQRNSGKGCPYGKELDIDINSIDKCQKRKEENDKALRIRSINYSNELVTQRREVYKFRNRILKTEDLLSEIESIVPKYVDDIVKNNKENLNNLLGHLIPINNNNSKTINDKLIKALKSKLNNKEKLNKLRTTILKIIDEYWFSQMEVLENGRVQWMWRVLEGKDMMENYNLTATTSFKDMIDHIYNEIITYSLNPDVEYGEYKYPQIKNGEKSKAL